MKTDLQIEQITCPQCSAELKIKENSKPGINEWLCKCGFMLATKYPLKDSWAFRRGIK